MLKTEYSGKMPIPRIIYPQTRSVCRPLIDVMSFKGKQSVSQLNELRRSHLTMENTSFIGLHDRGNHRGIVVTTMLA